MKLMALLSALALSTPVVATGLDTATVEHYERLGSFVKESVEDGLRGKELSEAVRAYKSELRAEHRSELEARKSSRDAAKAERKAERREARAAAKAERGEARGAEKAERVRGKSVEARAAAAERKTKRVRGKDSAAEAGPSATKRSARGKATSFATPPVVPDETHGYDGPRTFSGGETGTPEPPGPVTDRLRGASTAKPKPAHRR